MLSRLSNSIWMRFLFFSVIVIGPWCFVILVRCFGPINHPSISIELVAFLVSVITTTYVSFCFGFSFSHSKHCQSSLQIHTSGDVGKIFRSVRFMVLCMAVAYPLVSFFDFFIVKGAAISAIVEQRESEHLTGPRNSLIGAVGALLSGAPPVLLAMMNLSRFRNTYINYIMYIFIILGFASMFLSGGRNAFFISIIFVFFSGLFFSARPAKVISKFSIRKLVTIALVAYCIFFSMKMFLDRFEAQGFDVSFMLDYLELEYGVEIFRFDYNGSIFVAVYSVLVYLSFYISHALTYLNEYFVIGHAPYMGGGFNFPQIARLIDVAFGSDFFEGGRARMILVGVYLTLPGSLYLDFGILGSVAVCSLLGFYYGYLARNLAQLALYQKLCLTYVTVAMVFSPIYSVLGMANGFSLIFILLLTVFRSLKLRY